MKEALKYLQAGAIVPVDMETTILLVNALKEALAQPAQEPVCPECKAEVLYECVACSSNNYPPQGAQKPVAWMRPSEEGYDSAFRDHSTVMVCIGNPWTGWIPLYTAPPQRPWVDLTDDEEIADYLGDEYHTMTESDLRFFRLGEAAAKEKNNGT